MGSKEGAMLVDNSGRNYNSEKKSFAITKAEILEIFDKYDHRDFNEEILAINCFGGDAGIARALITSTSTGLSKNDDLLLREKEFGSNMVEQEPLPHCCTYVWEALGDLMLRILIVAAIVQIILGVTISAHPDREWIEGFSILVAVCVVVSVGSITNYQKEKKFKELNDRNSSMVKVTIKRDGEPLEKSPDDILVGDLIKVNTGSIVPADGILVSVEGQIKIEESSLTGESDLIEKDPLEVCIQRSKEFEGKPTNKHSIPSPLIFSGTLVKEGNGWFIALAVGSSSKKGMIKDSVQANQENDDSKTPLEIKLDELATQIGYFGMVAAGFTFIALMIRFGVTYADKVEAYDLATKSGDTKATDPQKTVAHSILSIILLCVAIVVVSIPEGLPLAVTLSLAFSIKKMMNDYNLVRKMYACETMGGANFICSDKTGTLTMNIMNVFNIFDGQTDVDVSSVSKTKSNSSDFFSEKYFDVFKTSLSCNLQMTINDKEEIFDESKTDLAFANLLHNFNVAIFPIQTKFNVNSQEIKRLAFSSARKKMSTLVSSSLFPTGHRIFMKGASEIVMQSVEFILNASSINPIRKSDEITQKIKETINSYAHRTLRTISVAYKDITQNELDSYLAQDENGNFLVEKGGFTLVCIAGIKDTLREGVKEAISNCHSAGINVVMVTGDLKETAVAISKECGIWNLPENTEIPENYSLTGEEFFNKIGGIECEICGKTIKECDDPKTKREAEKRGIDQKYIQKHRIKNMGAFEKIVANLRVLARSRPLDKYALVLGLRSLENVVAVTGDGTNDAQALSKSDVGFAMGIEGTDVAKDAADIIILNDNFASIVKAVTWGRNIYDCIRKFIQFQLTVNLTACALVFVCACIGSETPISPIQMLWLNMIMDSLGSLALATEPPHEHILQRKPNNKKEHIINTLMWKHIIGHSIVLFTVLLILYLIGPNFIVEDHPLRMAEADLLSSCYGHWPGRPPINGEYTIISGSVNDWPSTSLLLSGKTAVECGNYIKSQEMSLAYISYKSQYGNSAHMTILFNVFVIYTLMNQLNSRVITDEFNIFKNITLNFYFVVLIFAEAILQIILIQFGSVAFSVNLYGLTGKQWGICVGFALLSFITSMILKTMPLEYQIQKIIDWINKCKQRNKVEPKYTEEASKQLKDSSKIPSLVNNLRKPTLMDKKSSSKIRAPKIENS